MNLAKEALTGFCLISLLSIAGDASASDWRKISEEDGVTVYQKDAVEGGTVSLRGETTIAASMTDILSVMKENATAHEWIPMVKTRRDLKQVADNERIEYTHIGMPWPLSDRYFINKARADILDNGQMRIFVQSIDDPEESWLEKDKVLGVMHYSEFLLTPVGDGQTTKMQIEVNSDPKGLIPKFLVNAAQRSWPRKFFNGLTDMLRKAGKITDTALVH